MMALEGEALLRGLTGGMSLADFNREIRERRVGYFARAIAPSIVHDVFSLAKMEELIAKEGVVAPYVDIFDERHLRRLVDVQRKSGKSCVEVASECLAGGATIRVRDADKFDLLLSRFANEVQRMFVAEAQVNIYLTPPAKDGFPPHFDITDVFVIQCLGAKEWRLFPDYTNRVDLPQAETNWEPDRYQPTGASESITLLPGDVLYLPRGAMHQAFCTERESLHLTVSVAPVTVADMLVKAVRRAANADIELRRRFPWPAAADGGAEEIAVALRDTLLGLPDRVDLKELVRAEYPQTAGPGHDSPGRFAAAIAVLLESGEPTGENELRPRSRDSKT